MRQILLSLALLSATFLSAKVQKQTLPIELDMMDPYYLVSDPDKYPEDIYGNLKLDSLVWKDEYNEKRCYMFDANGRLTKSDHIYPQSLGHFQIIHTYDANGNCVESVAQKPNLYTVQWDNVQKATYTRDEKGRAISEVDYLHNDGEWNPISKYECTFDAHDNLTYRTIYDYEEGMGWKTASMYKYEYTYNDKGQYTNYEYSKWNPDDGWTKEFMSKVEYDEKGRETYYLESLYWDKFTSSWLPYSQTKTSYTTGEGIVVGLGITERWNSSTQKWESYSLTGYNFDENGREILYTLSYYQNSEFELYLKRTTTYNAKGQLLIIDEERSSNKKRTEYMYDELGNRSAVLSTLNGASSSSYRWYYSAPQGINEVMNRVQTTPTRKVLRNGQLLIYCGEEVFTVGGAIVK